MGFVYILRDITIIWSGIGGQPTHLCLCEDLGLLTLLQTGSEAGHYELFCTDHLHDLLVTLYAHTLVNNKTTSNYTKWCQHV